MNQCGLLLIRVITGKSNKYFHTYKHMCVSTYIIISHEFMKIINKITKVLLEMASRGYCYWWHPL